MRLGPLVRAVSLTVAVAACGDTPEYAPDGPTLAYGVQTLDGNPASEHDLRELHSVVSRRMAGAGYTSFVICSRPAESTFTVLLQKAQAPNIDEIAALIERPGTLEFRIRADASEERKQRDIREASGGTIRPPSEFIWVPRRSGGPDMLVCTPERPLHDEVEKLRKRGVSEASIEMMAAVAKYDEAVRAEVFTGDRLDRAEARAGSRNGRRTTSPRSSRPARSRCGSSARRRRRRSDASVGRGPGAATEPCG